MSGDHMSKRVDFLLHSYSNTQSVIQFFDAKAGAYITLNGVISLIMINSVIPTLKAISDIASPGWRFALLGVVGTAGLLFSINVAMVFYRAFLVLSPRFGSVKVKKGKASGLFWAPDVSLFIKSHGVDEYADRIASMTERKMIVELSYEAAKLSYITSEKQNQLTRATGHFKWSLVLWAVLLLVCSVTSVVI